MKNKKVIAMVLTMSVVGALAIGGTLAWLTSSPEEVVNTFNISTVGGDIDEADKEGKDGDRDKENDYDMVPGKSESKDPTIHMNKEETTVPVYVIIEVEEDIKDDLIFSKYIKYSVDDKKWTQLDKEDFTVKEKADFDGHAGIYYCEYDPATAEVNTEGVTDLEILSYVDTDGDNIKDSQGITYSKDITNEMMKAFITKQNDDGTSVIEGLPELKFRVHIIQKEGFETVTDAAKEITGLGKPDDTTDTTTNVTPDAATDVTPDTVTDNLTNDVQE